MGESRELDSDKHVGEYGPVERDVSLHVANALGAAGKIAGQAWKGQAPSPASEEELRAAIQPLVEAGFAAAGRMLKDHKPTPEQRRAVRKATIAMARQVKERASAALRPAE